ncbi:MAG: hypothetical protein RI900_1910 [Actinomycetota bacterium]|jgi:hypothetical protein
MSRISEIADREVHSGTMISALELDSLALTELRVYIEDLGRMTFGEDSEIETLTLIEALDRCRVAFARSLVDGAIIELRPN